MASGKKFSPKQKLPADLIEAELLVGSTNAANKAIANLHQQLHNTAPLLIDGSQADTLSTNSLTTWLIAKFGVEKVQKLLSVMAALPLSIPSSRKLLLRAIFRDGS